MMFKRHAYGTFIAAGLLFAIPANRAFASDSSSTSSTSSTHSGGSQVVSGTDPEPTSPNVVQTILTILSLV